MKKILVPTDFSTPAYNALEFAIHLANHFGGHIELIHVYEVIHKTGMLKSVRDFMQRDAEEQLSRVVKLVKAQLFPQAS